MIIMVNPTCPDGLGQLMCPGGAIYAPPPIISLHGDSHGDFFYRKVCLIPPLSFLSQNLVALVSPVQPPAAIQDFDHFNFEQLNRL